MLLALAGQTTGNLPADEQAMVAGQQGILSPLACPATLRELTLCQSRVRNDADEPAADVLSPYDMYYANGLYCGNCENSPHKDGATRANTHDESPVGAKLRCYVLRCMSWLAAYGEAALVCTPNHWEQVAVLRCEQARKDEKVRLDPNVVLIVLWRAIVRLSASRSVRKRPNAFTSQPANVTTG
jgi:hypothetical protein